MMPILLPIHWLTSSNNCHLRQSLAAFYLYYHLQTSKDPAVLAGPDHPPGKVISPVLSYRARCCVVLPILPQAAQQEIDSDPQNDGSNDPATIIRNSLADDWPLNAKRIAQPGVAQQPGQAAGQIVGKESSQRITTAASDEIGGDGQWGEQNPGDIDSVGPALIEAIRRPGPDR
jgi:hypothetical protein